MLTLYWSNRNRPHIRSCRPCMGGGVWWIPSPNQVTCLEKHIQSKFLLVRWHEVEGICSHFWYNNYYWCLFLLPSFPQWWPLVDIKQDCFSNPCKYMPMYGTNKRPIIESFKAGSGHLIDRAMRRRSERSWWLHINLWTLFIRDNIYRVGVNDLIGQK